MISIAAFRDEMVKISARRGMKEIAKYVSKGLLGDASRLARTPGVVRPSAAGSAIKDLGMGGEGLATMVAHPQHGVAVRKLYNPTGLSSPVMIARKEIAGRAIGKNPHVAEFLGSASTPRGQSMHFNEYIPGQAPSSSRAVRNSREFNQSRGGAVQAIRDAGFRGGEDIRPGNMIRDSRTNRLKTIDYLPSREGEFAKAPSRVQVGFKERFGKNVLTSTPTATSSGIFNSSKDTIQNAAQLKAQSFAQGNNARPGVVPRMPKRPRLTPDAAKLPPTVAKPPQVSGSVRQPTALTPTVVR